MLPDWVCEVLSPGTRAFDLTGKRRLYAARWHRSTLAHRSTWRNPRSLYPRPRGWTLVAALKNDDEARVAPFDAIGFPLSVLWPD